jgi:hypothetical protein
VAVFAMSAVVTATASAAPHFYKCVKAAGGKYEDSKCSKEGAVKEFNRVAIAAGTTVTFTGTSPAGKLVSAAGTIECAEDTATGGVIEGPRKIKEVKVAYKKCKSSGLACSTAGAAPEEIRTKNLEGELVYLQAGAKNVGARLKPIAGAEFTEGEITCAFVKTKVTKEVLGELQPQNESNTAGKLIFEENAGKTTQRWRQVEEAGAIIELEAFGKPARLTNTENLTFATAVGVE